ncbi:prevent-host-death family protein [Nostoc carneum NIES-2107]|nr:prevent-host-death family protein [Nostoc carneum NIES-2107]
MNWKLDEAQQKLPEVIDAIASEPQLIFKQDKLVAAIVEPKLFQEFLAWHQQQKVSPLADAFAELR